LSQLLFREQLEKHNQPKEVRQLLASGQYNEPCRKIAQEYLDSIDRKEAAEGASLREDRELEALAIARESAASARDSAVSAESSSNSAFEQARWAKWAAIIAMIAVVVATKEQIIALIFGHA
jgi:hypothetical protein